jgi:hypothetical protein
MILPLVFGVVAAGLALAPSAGADCVSSGGTTLCSQGDARGSDTGQGPGTYTPYPCELDWYCDQNEGWGLGIILDPSYPARPNNDLPGGNRGGLGGRR